MEVLGRGANTDHSMQIEKLTYSSGDESEWVCDHHREGEQNSLADFDAQMMFTCIRDTEMMLFIMPENDNNL